MINTATNFNRVFRHLCHIVALRQEGKLEAAIQSIVLMVFAFDTEFSPTSYSEIGQAISVYFGIQLSSQDIRNALDNLTDGERVDIHNGTYMLGLSTAAEYAQRIKDANELGDLVRKEWLEEIRDLDFERIDNWEKSFWDCLTSYMAKAFYRHGVQTVQLLDPTVPSSTNDTASIQSYLADARADHCEHIAEDVVTQAIQRFFVSKSVSKTQYVTQLLDGTFTYFALTTDEVVARYLTERMPSVIIFMDSNFIFGLFDLHDNPLNEVSKELVDCISANEFPFKLYYTAETLDEIERTLFHYGENLKGTSWTQKTSRIALNSRLISGIERRFHTLNAVSPISPDLFLAQFEQISTLLDERGFEVFDEDMVLEQQEQYDILQDYDTYLIERRGFSKGYETRKHDVVLWQTVQAKRRANGHGLDCGAFFMTVDHNFAAFDRKRLRKGNRVATAVFPNQMLQLLKPFMATSNEVDRQFMETFALPEFRIAHKDYSDTMSKVLSMINSLTDLSTESAIKIVTNQMAIEQLGELDENTDEFRTLFESEIARENKRLSEQKSELERRTRSNEEEMRRVAAEARTSAEQLQLVSEQKAQVEQESRVTIDGLKAEAATIASEKESVQQRSLNRERILYAAIFLISSLAVIGYLANAFLSVWISQVSNNGLLILYILLVLGVVSARIGVGHRWEWLRSHPKKRGLHISSAIVLAGLFLLLADPANSQLGVGGMFVGGLVALASMVD